MVKNKKKKVSVKNNKRQVVKKKVKPALNMTKEKFDYFMKKIAAI